MASLNFPFLSRPPAVAVVRLQGPIAASGRALSDASLGPVLERAFRRGRPAAVALVLNCPGGSAVQSSLIAARIRRLADEKRIPVLAFVEDVAASGGYWLATAADEIFADEASILGSIGVIAASFGFHRLLDRQGVERRVHTAGTSKSFLDPFRPERPEDVARLRTILDPLHAIFIAQVKARRGAKLVPDRDLFDGSFWTAREAIALGLADGIGHLAPVLKERFGDKVRLLRHGPRRSLLGRVGLAAPLCADLTRDLAADLLAEVEHRAMLARYGL